MPRLVTLIEHEEQRGSGLEWDPCRIVLAYSTVDGEPRAHGPDFAAPVSLTLEQMVSLARTMADKREVVRIFTAAGFVFPAPIVASLDS